MKWSRRDFAWLLSVFRGRGRTGPQREWLWPRRLESIIAILDVLACIKGLGTIGMSGLTRGRIMGYLECSVGYDVLRYLVLISRIFVTRCCA